MEVDPTRPGNMYTGADFQKWQMLQRPTKSPDPPPNSTSSVVVSPTPFFPASYRPVTLGDGLPGPPPYRGSNRAGAGVAVGGGVGIAAALGQKSGDLAQRVVEYVWPLKACIRLGENMVNAKPWVRFWTAVLCALVGVGLAAGAGWNGSALFMALAIGGILGWLLPTLVGSLLAFGAYLTGFVIGLSLLALVIVAILFVVRAITS